MFSTCEAQRKLVTCRGESPDKGFTPVTEQPMIKPCRRTPRYHFGPILFSLTSLKPAFWNHSIYSSSFGKSIHISAKKRDSQKVGYTGPITQAFPPIFSTLYASLMPRCGSGQYSILKNRIKVSCKRDRKYTITSKLTITILWRKRVLPFKLHGKTKKIHHALELKASTIWVTPYGHTLLHSKWPLFEFS